MQRFENPDAARMGNPSTFVVALVVAASVVGLSLVSTGGRASAVTADQARQQLGQISGSIDELRAGVAADNRRIDGLIGTLSALRSEAAALDSELADKQAKLDELEADLEREKRQLVEARKRLDRALEALRKQLVSLYMTGPPTVSGIVFGSDNFSAIATNSAYAESIQDRDEVVIQRVRSLRDEIRRTVERMKVRQLRLTELRDEIAVEAKKARVARDQVEAQRAEFISAREGREARIRALEERAGSLEDSLPDLTSDPASSSAPRAPAPVPGQRAVLGSDGLAAAPAGAPDAVKRVIAAANAIAYLPYVWGGGHGSFDSSGYDCSGAVSYALNGGGLLSSPLDSTGLTTWGEPGVGNWITVYGNSGHVYMTVAGLRWDTSDTGGTGPSWHSSMRSSAGFIPRHPSGL